MLFPPHSLPRYSVVVEDSAWPESGGGGRGAQEHYPLMTVKQIIALPVVRALADDAHYYWPASGAQRACCSPWLDASLARIRHHNRGLSTAVFGGSLTPITLAVPSYLLTAAQQLVTASTVSPTMTILYQNTGADPVPPPQPPNRLQRRAALARQRRCKR